MINIQHFSLPNLLADEALVPELLQEALTVDAVVAAVRERLYAQDGCAALLARFDQMRGRLANDASAHAAQAVLEHARL
jgi:lipid-A-disaccharide synthase